MSGTHPTGPRRQKGFSVWLTKRKPCWIVQFNLNGVAVQERLPDIAPETPRRDVEAAMPAYVAGRREDEAGHVEPQPLKAIDEHAASIKHRSKGHRDNCARYADRLREFFNKRVNPCALDKGDLERWRDWLLYECPIKENGRRVKGLSKKSAAEHLHWLQAVRKVAGMPIIEGVRFPRKTLDEASRDVQFFTVDEIPKLIAAAYSEPLREPRERRFYNGLIFLLYTGCRAGEMQGITPADLNPSKQVVRVVGKGEKPRHLSLTGPMQPAWDALRREMEDRPGAPTIFVPWDGWPRKSMDRIARAALGRRGYAHMARHTFASLALQHFEPPWDIGYLAKWLGHADVSVTYRIYSHWLAPPPHSGPAFNLPTAAHSL